LFFNVSRKVIGKVNTGRDKFEAFCEANYRKFLGFKGIRPGIIYPAKNGKKKKIIKK